jgi:hypothetical protein
VIDMKGQLSYLPHRKTIPMLAVALTTIRTDAPATPTAYQAAYEQFESLVTRLRARATQQMTHSEVEQLIETEGCEILRRLLQAHLDERSPGSVTPPVVDAQGQVHTHQRSHTRQLESLFGTVTVTRIGYGGRGLESLHPLDAQLNLPPERYSHTVRRRAAEAAAQTSYEEVIATLAQTTGAHVPKRQAEALVRSAATDFEPFYESQRAQTQKEVRATSELLLLSSDGKGVPMRTSDLRGPTRQAAQAPQQGRKAAHQTDGDSRGGLYHGAFSPHAGADRGRVASARESARLPAPAPGRQARLGECQAAAGGDPPPGL